MIYTYITLTVLLSTSCIQAQNNRIEQDNSGNKKNENYIKDIDLNKNIRVTDEKMRLSDVVSEVEYIKLETTNTSLLPSISNIQVTDKYILTSSLIFKEVYLFDRKGKFIRTLGKVGQGPGEYISSQSYTCNDSIIYIQSSPGIKMYNLKNNIHIGNIPYRDIGKINVLPNEKNKICMFINSHCDIKKIFTALITNNKGDTIQYIRPKLNIESLNKLSRYVFTQELCTWETKNHINVYEFNNDTIYKIGNLGISPRYKLNLGKYKMPDNIFYDRTARFKKEPDYYTIRSFIESSEYLYISFNYQGIGNYWYAQYSKKNETIKLWHPKNDINYGSGFYNDIDGGPLVYLNRHIKGDYLWSLIDQETIQNYLTPEHFASMEAKFPEKKAELQNLLKSMKEDDNPIIVLYKLK